MGLSDGRKGFRIGLAVLIQYRSVTDTQPPSHPATQPPSHVAVAITLYAVAPSAKTMITYYDYMTIGIEHANDYPLIRFEILFEF